MGFNPLAGSLVVVTARVPRSAEYVGKRFNPLAGSLVVVTVTVYKVLTYGELFQSPCGEFGRCDRSRLKPFNCRGSRTIMRESLMTGIHFSVLSSKFMSVLAPKP